MNDVNCLRRWLASVGQLCPLKVHYILAEATGSDVGSVTACYTVLAAIHLAVFSS